MFVKKYFVIIFIFTITLFLTGCGFKKLEQEQDRIPNEKPQVSVEEPRVKVKSIEKKYDLYSSSLYDLPLFSIYEISRLPLGIKKSVDKILEVSQGFYFLKYNEGKVLIVLQNPIIRANTYQRHGLQFIEILNDGTIRDYVAGYSGIEGEMEESNSTSDLWDYDDSIDIKRPLKHISFDEKGKVSFVETWNYDEQEPIKYQMRDASKKVLSVLKETKDNDLNLRREHIFYDNAGNIKMSVSVNYDGANISRFNFYNSHDSIDGVSVISEYSEGMKIKEYIYDEDYSLNYTVVADYLNDDRKSITIFDSEGNVINKITS